MPLAPGALRVNDVTLRTPPLSNLNTLPVPAIETGPLMLLLALSTSVPLPFLINPKIPARIALIFTSLPVPSAFTVIAEVPLVDANVNILAAVPLLVTIQPAVELVTVSPKISVPEVRGESNFTVTVVGVWPAVPVISTVLKFATLSVPSAITEEVQFAGSLQRPSASTVHVPLAAMAAPPATICASASIKTMG
ncbi:MAG: hypothetical protein QOD99_2365 [Chthoniobacter sp.]|nr:hypothetical protein [Chthoniobacter sp.]